MKKFQQKMIRAINRFADTAEKHDFSMLWSSVLIISGVFLAMEDFPSVIQETLPYNGVLLGIVAVAIGIFKNIGIHYRNFSFHVAMDCLGSFWYIYMGLTMITSLPPLLFVGYFLVTIGIGVDLRLFIRGWRKQTRWTNR